MAEIRRRHSIHENPDQPSNDENLKVMKCSDCNLFFKVSLNNQEEKIEDEELFKLVEEKKTITNLYPDLSKDMPFQCQGCKGGPNCNTVKWKTFQKHLPRLLLWLVCACLVILLVLNVSSWSNSFFIPKAKSFPVNVQGQSFNEQVLDKVCLELEKNFYKNQNEEIWPILLSGIKAITKNKPNHPAVFLMLYNDRSAGKIARCLAKRLSDIATKYISIGRSQPVELTGKELDTSYYIEDSGRVLTKYEELIRRNGAMILTDLQDVPAEVARKFHFMADKYTPLVEKAVYFFTLYVDSNTQDYREWSKTAQETLKNLWKPNLHDELLIPLLTRMTQETIAISSGDSIHC